MPFQDVPTTPNRPNYGALKEAEANKDTLEVNQVLEQTFPDNPANPAFAAFKKLVRQFMLNRDEHGLIMVPNTYQAMVGVHSVVDSHRDLADPELVKRLTWTAQHDGECIFISDYEVKQLNKGSGEIEPLGRGAAIRALGEVIDKRPDLVDTALLNNLSHLARNEPDSSVRAGVQDLFGKIAAARPELVNNDVIKAVSETASSTATSRPNSTGTIYSDGRLGHVTLLGYQSDEIDQEARRSAKQTLDVMKSKRPDLFPAEKLAPRSRVYVTP
jgi:hypothetical protein